MKSFLRIFIIVLLVTGTAVYFSPLNTRMRGLDAIVIHESAERWGNAATIRGYHMRKGWSDIGYHAVILNGKTSRWASYNPQLDGKIEPGRPETMRGSHCKADNMNSHALGVCLVGDPRYTGYPTGKQMDSLIHYCAVKCVQYGIPVENITQHSDHEPEKPLDASLDLVKLRELVQAEIDSNHGIN